MQAAGAGLTRQVRVVNGVTEIEVREAGRKIRINEDPNNGIKIEVSETKDGKETKRTYAAKNAEELKKNHPEGHQLYEKHAKQQGVFQIQVQGVGGMPLGGGLPGAVPMREAAPKQAIAAALRHAQQLVETAVKQFERLPQAADGNEGNAQAQKRWRRSPNSSKRSGPSWRSSSDGHAHVLSTSYPLRSPRRAG